MTLCGETGVTAMPFSNGTVLPEGTCTRVFLHSISIKCINPKHIPAGTPEYPADPCRVSLPRLVQCCHNSEIHAPFYIGAVSDEAVSGGRPDPAGGQVAGAKKQR